MQIILSILANAGGVGKTTMAVHLAYEMSQRGFSVALLDLDPQKSVDVFCGLDAADYEDSLVGVLAKKFNGNWPLVEVWDSEKIEVCRGHQLMSAMADELVTRRRGDYALSDRLRKFPLPHNLVIIDCPATLGMLTTNALAASTQVLVPVQMEMKSATGAAGLIEWCIQASEELELEPRPPILGLVPSIVDEGVSIHRKLLAQLPDIASSLDLKLYPYFRYSREFKNASAMGIPLQIHRPKHPACSDLKPICDDISSLIKNGN
ncbi:MAG: ParA family protein [Thermosynechococcaceae cyanobacterium]